MWRRSRRGPPQSGFVQSDIAYWAYNGTGIYEGRPKVDGLRAIANLYPESIQLVVRKGSGIKSVRRPARPQGCRSTSRARARWSTRG